MAVHKETFGSISGKAREDKGSTPLPPAAKASKPISSSLQRKHPAAELSGENKHLQSKADIKQPKGIPRSDASTKVKETPSRTASGLRIQGPDSKTPSHNVASPALNPTPRHSSKTLDARSDSVPLKLKHLSKSGDFRSESMRKPREFLTALSLSSTTKGPAANGGEKSAAKGSTSALCTECHEISEGAVCFIGNDGRVSACSSRTSAARLCKNPKCANSNPELAATMAAVGPKKYLVSKRHSLKAASQVVLSNYKSVKSVGGSSTRASSDKSINNGGNSQHNQAHSEGGDCSVEEELRDHYSTEYVPADGCLLSGNGVTGHLRVRRRSFSVIEKQGPEEVILRKQMTQERRNAEEWMLDYAIEEALHKLGPTKGTKVKVLVEAFESVIPHKDLEGATQEVKL